MFPKLIPAKNNNRFVIYNNMLFILTPWIDGINVTLIILIIIYLSCKTLGKYT